MQDFRDSKIKDICYHGTSSEPFTVLDKTRIQKDPEEGDPGYFGWGFYLTTNREYAEEFGDTVLAFKVNIQNPFDFTNINAEELVNFIFEDCKHLKLRVKETLRIINQIGRGLYWDFETNNSDELLDKCKKLYNTYRQKEVDEEYITDVKSVLIELAKNVSNWLNGLFFYFGRELFHYFTMNGYDGIIALGGEEIVVYETEQLKPVDDIEEDITLMDADTPNDWKEGSKEFTDMIAHIFDNNPDFSDLNLFGNTFYPKRCASVWWEGTPILSVKYKDLLKIYFYCGGELYIYYSEDDDDLITSPEDLEDIGIYDDSDYYRFMDDGDIWNKGWADENTLYFGFTITPLKNNPNRDEIYGYDLGYDDMYDLDDYINNRLCTWLEGDVIPDFMEQCPEYFEEEQSEEEPVQEEVKSKKKHITKGQVLRDIINTFGITSANEMTDAIYLLPNGDILNCKGPYEKSQHENVAKYISKKYNIKDIDENQGSKLMLELGAMRITPWIPAMFIPDNLTEKQQKALYDIIQTLSSKVSVDNPLMVATQSGDNQIQFETVEDPEEIINSILGYQVFGILKA